MNATLIGSAARTGRTQKASIPSNKAERRLFIRIRPRVAPRENAQAGRRAQPKMVRPGSDRRRHARHFYEALRPRKCTRLVHRIVYKTLGTYCNLWPREVRWLR